MKRLAVIAEMQPHAAYPALTHGLLNKWNYLFCTIGTISDMLHPLDEALRSCIIPALTGRLSLNHLEISLFGLPARLGGLDINIPSLHSKREFRASLLFTNAICECIQSRNHDYDYDVISKQLKLKAQHRSDNQKKSYDEVNELDGKLTDKLKRAMYLAR